MKIKNFDIKKNVFLIAEIGNNHEGSFELASRLIKIAYEAGAHAVKFQTIDPELLVHSEDKDRLNTLRKFYLNPEQYKKLEKISKELGLIFLSTPFSLNSINWLNNLLPAYKISSGDITFLSLIKKIAEQGKPILLSTGMSNLDEIETAIKLICDNSPLKYPKENICIMHCVSSYPTEYLDANLNCLNTLKNFGCYVGYSDHTLGIEASICAISLGARIIEKHFTISKTYSSFRDHQLSADPEELKELAIAIRKTEDLLGSNKKHLLECEENTYLAARRSLVSAKDLIEGSIIKEDDFIALRPLKNIPVEKLSKIVGKRINKSIKKGIFINNSDIS